MIEERVLLAKSEGETLIQFEIFEKETVSEVDFRSMDFENIEFVKCRFTMCDFTKSCFRDVQFIDCDFSNCKFIDTYWNKGEIVNCKGDGSNFSNSHFKFLTMKNDALNFVNMATSVFENCILEACQMQKAFFSEVKLKKTIISDIHFGGTDFYKTPLKGIDLSTSNIENIMLSEGLPELKGAKINMFQAVEIVQILGIKVV